MAVVPPTVQLKVVRRVRIVLFILTIINLILMVALYSFQAFLNNNPTKHRDEPRVPSLLWQDYLEIIFSVFFVFVYFYALSGFRFVPKFFRVVLLLVPAVLLIYVSIFSMVQASDNDGNGSAFKCGGRDRGGKTWCQLNWTNKFLSALLGFFVLFEIPLTMVWGPMDPNRDYLPQYNDGHAQPVVHDGGQTGSPHAMIEHAQSSGPTLGIPAATVLAGNGATVAPHPGYSSSQKPILLGDINNNNGAGAGGEAYKVGANVQEQYLPPPQVVYQYPAPQKAQYKDQHEQFETPQPIPTISPTDPQPTNQAPLQQQQQQQPQQQQQAAPLVLPQPFEPTTGVHPLDLTNTPPLVPSHSQPYYA
ncbi:hypothetical protein BGZ47_004506 [Haplosporangium gracile]|nr:hypothetical protein BGZ47_004506 [Haplosporangium gracile]